MAGNLKQEWREKFIKEHCEDSEDGLAVYEIRDIDGIVDCFYSLHKEKIAEIRKSIEIIGNIYENEDLLEL